MTHKKLIKQAIEEGWLDDFIDYPDQKIYIETLIEKNLLSEETSFPKFFAWYNNNYNDYDGLNYTLIEAKSIWGIHRKSELYKFFKEFVETGAIRKNDDLKNEQVVTLNTLEDIEDKLDDNNVNSIDRFEAFKQSSNLIYFDDFVAVCVEDDSFIIISSQEDYTYNIPFSDIKCIIGFKFPDSCFEHENIIHSYAGETSGGIGGFTLGTIHTTDDKIMTFEMEQVFAGKIVFYMKDFSQYAIEVDRIEIVDLFKAYADLTNR